MKSSTQSPEFDPTYYSQVIPASIRLPKLHNYASYHEAYVSVGKLQEMYQALFTYLDQGVQEMVPYPVLLPVMHDFGRVNREGVTVAVLRELYRTLYKVDTPHTIPPPAAQASG